MSSRMKNPVYVLPDATKGVQHLLKATGSGRVPELTRELVALRASQINGCGACVHGHVTAAKKLGETDERLGLVATWREAPFYTDAERAALALTEAATRLADLSAEAVPDALWEEVCAHYDEEQRSALLLTIALTNLFNRVNVSIKEPAGTTW